MQQKNNFKQRNKLLTSSKRDLIKICKQNHINIKGCLAKMDFVGKILQNQKKKQNKKKKKRKKKTSKKTKTKASNTNNKKNKKNNTKNGSRRRSLSENQNLSDREKMLKLKKTDLLKFSKANALDTEYCFAKIDFVNTIMAAGYKYSDFITTNMSDETKTEAVKAKTRVAIDWDKDSETESDSEYSSAEFELACPEYIPARVSLNKVFDFNILTNIYKEEDNNLNKQRIKWGYSPFPTATDGNDKRKSESLSFLSTLDSPGITEQKGIIITQFKPANSMQTIVDDEDENEQDFKQQNLKWENDPFKRLDFALGEYYKYFDRKDYFNDKGEGKFILFCEYNKLLDEEMLNEQFLSSDDPQKCPYLSFDDTFPLILTVPIGSNKVETENELRLVEIYNVMEYCYHHGQSPYF